jgi:hypothetical protein
MSRIDQGSLSADELHFFVSKVAARFSDKQVMGPLSCRLTAVLMRNTTGVSDVPGQPSSLVKDFHADPQQLYLHFEYLDPDAAAAHISKREEEAKKREEETKRDGGSK